MNKKLVTAALVGAISAQQTVDYVMVEQVVEGVLIGALDAEGFDDITKCITDAEGVVTDVEKAFNDFEKNTTQGAISGVKDIADLLKNIKSGMQDCSHLEADWKTMEKMVEIFSSPTSFAYHIGKDLAINGVSIFKEVSEAIGDYKMKEWKEFGINVGKATAKTFIGSTEDVSDNKKKVS